MSVGQIDVQVRPGAAGPRALLAGLNPRTHALLHDPILPLLLRLAWPNVLVMLAQSATGLIETYFVGHLGMDALAGMALVFPGVMLMQMISAGAMGGGISSAIARALGAGRRADADALVAHALVINLGLGLAFSVLVLAVGRPLYRLLGGEGGSLEAALTYSNVVFAGMPLLWLMNAQASVIRGTGNMLVPSLVICLGVLALIPLSPALIFGLGPLPGLGVAGGGVALVLFYAAGALFQGWYVLSGRNAARLVRARPAWPMFRQILGVGAVATVSSLQTNLTIMATTAYVGAAAGPDAVAGYGTGARLEYLLIPLVFGLGAPLVALVGTNIGAGQRARALRGTAWGALIAFGLTEAIGLLAAWRPTAWLGLFGADPTMLATGAAYLGAVGPAYGFFGLGLVLYFASQGAGRLFWPLVGGSVRVLIAVGGGWLALAHAGLPGLFAALAVGLIAYGIIVAVAVWRGTWFDPTP